MSYCKGALHCAEVLYRDETVLVVTAGQSKGLSSQPGHTRAE